MACRPMSKPITPLRGLTPTLCSCVAGQLSPCLRAPPDTSQYAVQRRHPQTTFLSRRDSGGGRRAGTAGGTPGVTGGVARRRRLPRRHGLRRLRGLARSGRPGRRGRRDRSGRPDRGGRSGRRGRCARSPARPAAPVGGGGAQVRREPPGTTPCDGLPPGVTRGQRRAHIGRRRGDRPARRRWARWCSSPAAVDGVPVETFGPPRSPVTLPSTLAGPPAMKVIRATTDSAPAATANDSRTLAAAAVRFRAPWRAAWPAMTTTVVRAGIRSGPDVPVGRVVR